MNNDLLVYSGIRVCRGVRLQSSKGATPDASLCLRNWRAEWSLSSEQFGYCGDISMAALPPLLNFINIQHHFLKLVTSFLAVFLLLCEMNHFYPHCPKMLIHFYVFLAFNVLTLAVDYY